VCTAICITAEFIRNLVFEGFGKLLVQFNFGVYRSVKKPTLKMSEFNLRLFLKRRLITRAVKSVHKSSDSDSFIKAQYVLITVNL
jgi:hypothetical protein